MPKHTYSPRTSSAQASDKTGRADNVIFFGGDNTIYAKGKLFGGYISGDTVYLPNGGGVV